VNETGIIYTPQTASVVADVRLRMSYRMTWIVIRGKEALRNEIRTASRT
jgi:hypothetical protein